MLLIVALGLTIPLAVNEFDLSIAAMLGFAEVILAVLTVQQHWPLGLAVSAALAMAYKLLDAAHERWRRFNGHDLAADVCLKT